MLEQLDLRPGQPVLEIGAGTGYNAALLAHVVGDGGRVTTLDLDEDIVAGAAIRGLAPATGPRRRGVPLRPPTRLPVRVALAWQAPDVATPPLFMAFDCLYAARQDLRPLALNARRAQLEAVIRTRTSCCQFGGSPRTASRRGTRCAGVLHAVRHATTGGRYRIAR